MNNKILIKSDVFNINERIKQIDDGYFIIFDVFKKHFEIHNEKQIKNSYCLTWKKELDSRVLEYVEKTIIKNSEKILSEIEENNKKVESESNKNIADKTEFMFKEIYKYENSKVESNNNNRYFSIEWI